MSEEKNVRLLLSFLKKKKRKGCFSMYRLFFKRFLDIVLSFFGIVVLAVPMLIIAIIVKIDSKGPAVFKQKRVGKNGKPFNFYKFRSMRIDAPHDMATREIHSEDYTIFRSQAERRFFRRLRLRCKYNRRCQYGWH